MIVRFLEFENSQLRNSSKELLSKITNPGAMLTIEQIMVLEPSNQTFTLLDKEKITELITKDFK